MQHQSSFTQICETRLASGTHVRRKLLKTIERAYGKAPQFDHSFDLVRKIWEIKTEYIGELALESILAVVNYLGISTQVITTSRQYGNSDLKGVKRVLDICQRETASEYFNLPGGKLLYEHELFADAGVELRFLQPKLSSYRQFNCSQFVPWLSMIDVMMFNDRDTVREMLYHYEVT